MKKTDFNKSQSFAIFFISLLTFFLLGVFYADAVKDLYVKKVLKRDVESLVFNETLDVFGRKDLDLEGLWESYNIIRANYYSSGEIKKEDLEQGAIKGLVESLGDMHSEYMDPVETEQFNSVLAGDFEGIGAVVDSTELGIIVERVLKGSPAKEFGIRKGDIMIEANGIKLVGLNLYDAVEKIKGPAGTQVVLKFLRAGEKDILERKVTRQKINIPSVDSEAIEPTNDFYISVNMFGEHTVRDFLKALQDSESYDGLIIDLRDNGGGLLQSAVEMLSEFIPDGEILVTTKYRGEENNISYKSRNSGTIYGKKIVLLINGNSASASEIMAGALREYNKAILVGEKSYGKGSVQQPFEFGNGGLLKLTIARWFTPKGKNIDKEGIVPDIEVDFEEADYEEKFDRQLDEAKKILQIYKENEGIGISIDTYEASTGNDLEENE